MINDDFDAGLPIDPPERLVGSETILQQGAVVVPLLGLHQRRSKPMSGLLPYGDATIINFPAPKWQRNALRKNG